MALDASREMLASPRDVPGGASREEVGLHLEIARRHDAVMTADLPFIEYGGRIVAVAGRRRCYIAVDDLDAAALNFVAVMCLCKREVDEGRIEGPFNSDLAAKWARLVLIGPQNLGQESGTDDDVARRLRVPIEQVRLARREFGHLLQQRP